MSVIICPTRKRVSLILKTWIVCREWFVKLLGLRVVNQKDLKNWEKQISMANMNLKKSSIFILSKADMKNRKCWGCGNKKVVKFRDASTGGYLCQECMPDVYWAGVVLNSTDGIRDPKPGETYDDEERL